jgi:peptidoglycan hydrolase-like protein with peptidoglycan-binding domain
MAIKVPIGVFVAYLEWCLENKCGYIMGSYGQDPKKWSKTSWWFTQYSGEQKRKALYWRENAPLVHDCNGLAEGCYQKETGVNINSRARNNYSTWCSPKGSGKIPNKHKVPGAAVFIHNGSYISHVGYLWKPTDASKPSGDWWVIEDRGVMYGCVKTKLGSRGWNRYGLMTKYFDYTATSKPEEDTDELGHRVLKNGSVGDDVKQLQESLITLGYSCGKWGADGEFGPATQNALKAFQKDVELPTNGVADEPVFAAINKLLPEDGEEQVIPEPPVVQMVEIVDGNAWVRTQPDATSAKLGVAEMGDKLPYRGETVNGWVSVNLDSEVGWVSGKYAKLIV